MLKKVLAVLLTLVMSATFCMTSSPKVEVKAATSLGAQKAELDKELAQIEAEQKALDDKIAAAKTDLEKQQTKKNNLDYQITLTKRKIKVIEEKIVVIKGQISENEKEIAKIEIEIGEKSKEIDKYGADIDATVAEIEKKAEEIAELEEQIKENFETFKKRLRAFYMHGNSTILSVLLGADSFSDLLTKAEMIQRIADHDNALLEELTSTKDDVIVKKENLEKEKNNLEVDKEMLEKSQSELKESMAALEEKRVTLKESREELEDENEELTKQTSDLKEQIAEIEQQIQDIEELEQQFAEQGEVLKQQAQAVQDELDEIYKQMESTGEYIGGSMLWPVYGYMKITSEFGWRFNNTDYHTGFDIGGRNAANEQIYGKPVLAANYGTVTYKGYQENGYGNYIIIDHGGGLTTLYAHMSEVYVKKGDSVDRGQAVGAVGSTGWSTGPHLHFEVRQDGKAYNPRKEFPNYPNVPNK